MTNKAVVHKFLIAFLLMPSSPVRIDDHDRGEADQMMLCCVRCGVLGLLAEGFRVIEMSSIIFAILLSHVLFCIALLCILLA